MLEKVGIADQLVCWGVRLDMPVSELEMSTVGVGKITSGESDGAGKEVISRVQSLASSSSLSCSR